MKSFLLGVSSGALFLILAAIVYLRLGLAEIRADAPVYAWVSRCLSSAVHASVRRTAPALQNPLPSSDETLIAGAKLYLNDCVGCHGEPGKPPSDFGATFYPPAPQFPLIGTQYSEAQVFWVAQHGIRRTGMAAQRFSYSDEKLWSLAAFIRCITNLPPRVRDVVQQKPAS